MIRPTTALWIVFGVLVLGCTTVTADPTPTPGNPLIIQTLEGLPELPTPAPTVIIAAPTNAPSPTVIVVAPAPTYTPAPTEIAAVGTGAFVAEGRGGLRLRSLPGQDSVILLSLNQLTELTILGRSADNQWARVETSEGFTGWVWAGYLVIRGDLGSYPVIENPQPDYFEVEAPAAAAVTSAEIEGVTSTARRIFQAGQARGNRANVFSKVGDSLTVGTYFLYPIGWGAYNLRDYGYLLPTLQYFASATARDSNSFSNTSLAADNGWTTAHVLDPARANPSVCQPGETPLVCEYRVVKPAIALILFGTNDVSAMSAGEFSANLGRIVQISLDMGVIPVISTIPTRRDFDALVQEFNGVVRNTARGYDVPLWDYAAAMDTLPNRGLSADQVHPSWAPGDFNASADLSAENLQYGYPLRNLMALQVLDKLRQEALY